MVNVSVFKVSKDNLYMEYVYLPVHQIKFELMVSVFALQGIRLSMVLVLIVQDILNMFMESVYVMMVIHQSMENVKCYHVQIPIMSMIPLPKHVNVKGHYHG